MPRVYLSIEERECRRFSDFVRGELKRQGKLHRDLADELGLPRDAVTRRLSNKRRWTLEEIVQTISYLDTEYTIGGSNERQKHSRNNPDLVCGVPASMCVSGYEATYTG